MAMNLYAKVTLKPNAQIVPVVLIFYTLFFFFSIALVMYADCCKNSNCALKSDVLEFGCSRIDSALSTDCKAVVTSNKERDTGNEILRNSA